MLCAKALTAFKRRTNSFARGDAGLLAVNAGILFKPVLVLAVMLSRALLLTFPEAGF